jgi:hypothetical protein
METTISAGRVLLTGSNGFTASHIVQGLIARNYHIVGTVRSDKKAQDVIALHPSWKDHITWVCIADIGVADAYDEVFKDGPFDYIIHNASPVDFTVTDFQRSMIDPAVKGYASYLTTSTISMLRVMIEQPPFSRPRRDMEDLFSNELCYPAAQLALLIIYNPTAKPVSHIRRMTGIKFIVPYAIIRCNANSMIRLLPSTQLRRVMLLLHTSHPRLWPNKLPGSSWKQTNQVSI